MPNIKELVEKQIQILKSYAFFTDFMDSNTPHNKKFLEELKLFVEDASIKKILTKKEREILKHLPSISTYPVEKRYYALERWLTAELTSELVNFKLIKNPFSRDLKELYRLYQNFFPPDEQAPLKHFRLWIAGENLLPKFIIHLWDSRTYKNIYGHVVHPRYYLLVVKIKGVVVGCIIFNTISTEKMSFMVIEYLFVTLKGLEIDVDKAHLALALFERCKHYAIKDAIRYSHRHPLFILQDPNDPIKMEKKGVLDKEHDTVNPVARLRLYSQLGFRFLDFPYVQPILDEEVVDYLIFAILPFTPILGNEIDASIFKYALITYLGTWEDVDVTKYPIKDMRDYLDAMIQRGEKIRLMSYSDYIRKNPNIVGKCMKMRWKTDDL